METKNESDIVQAVKDIVTECTFNKVNLDIMPMFDVEYIFLNIRAKSVGEMSKIKLLCDKVEYFEIRNSKNLSKKFTKINFKIFIAYKQGNVRLIDNF